MHLMLPRTHWRRPWFGNGAGGNVGNDWLFAPLTANWLDPDSLVQNPLEAGVAQYPALSAWSDDHALHVEAEIPGLPLEALDVTVLGDELTIAGERPDLTEEGATYHRRERGVGKFRRVVRLPFEVKADAVEARLEHGVLHVTLPAAEAARPRKIEIRTTR